MTSDVCRLYQCEKDRSSRRWRGLLGDRSAKHFNVIFQVIRAHELAIESEIAKRREQVDQEDKIELDICVEGENEVAKSRERSRIERAGFDNVLVVLAVRSELGSHQLVNRPFGRGDLLREIENLLPVFVTNFVQVCPLFYSNFSSKIIEYLLHTIATYLMFDVVNCSEEEPNQWRRFCL